MSSVRASLSRVPSFEELPNVDSPESNDVELATVTVEPSPDILWSEEHSEIQLEIQLAYEEQRQIFEVEHHNDRDPTVCTS